MSEPLQRKPWRFVYQNMVCVFTYWDCPLTGLIEVDGQKLFCRIVDVEADDPEYDLLEINWAGKCDEFLSDYEKAYPHLFYVDGKRKCRYDGRDLSWFKDKWGKWNPIADQFLEATA